MYSTCIHCHAALGSNESIVAFPMGRRLAFDAARGRLWVVCSRCRRWNLTPLEERWEAIEDCERQFSGTRLRSSTHNIGLARLPSGMELIRIGKPLLPEIAAWRYAGAIRRRWLTYGLPGMAVASSLSMSQLGFPLFGVGVTIGSLGAAAAAMLLISWKKGQSRAVLPDGQVVRLNRFQTSAVTIEPLDEGGWGVRGLDPKGLTTGTHAVHGLRAVMTARNFIGADQTVLDDALRLLSAARDSEGFILRLANTSRRLRAKVLPRDVLIALEMALHEDVERRALEGELAALELEWKLADEIAHIADNLLPGPTPGGVT